MYSMVQDIQRILDLKRGRYFYQPPLLKTIILSKYKDDVTVEYAIRGITNKIFVSKYQLYLPDKKILKKKLKELLDKN